MIGALLTGVLAGTLGRILVPDTRSDLAGIAGAVIGVVVLLSFAGIHAVSRRGRAH